MDQSLKPYWLASRATLWIDAVGTASSKQRFGVDDRLKVVEGHLYGAHMVILGLHHLQTCLRFLKRLGVQFPPTVEPLVDAYLTAYRTCSIAEARSALEHEENRVAGLDLAGKKPYDGELPGPFITTWNKELPYLKGIRVLDRDFTVHDAITAAIALREPLGILATEWWQAAPPMQSGRSS